MTAEESKTADKAPGQLEPKPGRLVLIQHRMVLFREALGSLLQAQAGTVVVAQLAACTALIERIAQEPADVAYVEVPLAIDEKTEIERLAVLHPELRLVAVGPASFRRHLDRSWRGPVAPTESFSALVRAAALKETSAERCGVPPQFSPGAEAVLTHRELRVLALLSRGFTTSQVASKMKVSQRSIKYTREQIRTKLDAQSTTQALASGIRQGVLPTVGGS